MCQRSNKKKIVLGFNKDFMVGKYVADNDDKSNLAYVKNNKCIRSEKDVG